MPAARRATGARARKRRWTPPDLSGRVALVAGATRGAGRGIARALGEAGATVYCTGRSVRGRPATAGRPETIQETARLVTQAGGRGIAVRVDHRDERQVRRLVERIRRRERRLDVLVNDIWGGDALTQWGTPFWKLDVGSGLDMLATAIHTHIVTARHAVPLMLGTRRSARRPGLIVEITDGDGWSYRGNLFYDLVKTAVIRLAFAYAYELRTRRIASLAVTPGFLRSEAMLDHFGVTKETWRDAIRKDPHFAASETPLFVGRAVAALAASRDLMAGTGRVTSSWAVARKHEFPDEDGARPDWGRHAAKHLGMGRQPPDEAFYRSWWEGPLSAVMPDWP